MGPLQLQLYNCPVTLNKTPWQQTSDDLGKRSLKFIISRFPVSFCLPCLSLGHFIDADYLVSDLLLLRMLTNPSY